jgi:hypothetical protein
LHTYRYEQKIIYKYFLLLIHSILVTLIFLPLTSLAQKKDSNENVNKRIIRLTHIYPSNKKIYNFHPESNTDPQERLQYESLIKQAMQPQILFPFPNLISSAKSSKILGSLSLTITPTGTTCGYSNGSFTVNASGGTPPYSYSENGYPFQSGAVFTQKAPGTYNVTVKDASGQTVTASVTLNNTYPPPSINIVGYTVPSNCTGMDGTVTVQATGGTPPYTYSDDLINFQTSTTFTNLPSVYVFFSFFVKDANGCTYPAVFPFYDSYCAITSMIGSSGASCHNDGWVSLVSTTGGTAPYQYSMDGTHYQASGYFSNLPAGILLFYTKDAIGKIATIALQMFPNCILDISAIELDANCGNKDGTITITATNGAAPYQYSLDGINFQASNIFSGLAPGNYTVYVMDANSMQGIYNGITINTSCPPLRIITTDATCGASNGTITVTANYGTAPYQ